MKAAIDGMIHLRPENDQDEMLLAQLEEEMTFVNPNWSSANSMGASTKGIARFARYFKSHEGYTSFPRALLTPEMWAELSEVIDKRVAFDKGPELATEFDPRPDQPEAIQDTLDALNAYPWGGVLNAPCGSGKTVMGLEVIRRIGVPTAVLVHKEFLVRQWRARAAQFLPGARIGTIRLDHIDSGKDFDIVICMMQSLLARDYPQEVYDSFGLVVSDEVHRLGAPKWHDTITRFRGARRLGLTATARRKDGLAPVFLAHIGPICHEMPARRLVPRLGVRRLDTKIDRNDYYAHWMKKPNIGKLVTALAKKADRTALIIEDTLKAVEHGRKILLLTARREHVNLLVGALAKKGVDVSRFVGGMKEHEQDEALESDVVVGTYPMAQEGLDCPEFDTLILATPQSDIEQAVGRILRECEGKKDPLVVDYVDKKIGVCNGMFRARSRIYARLGVGTI